MAEGAPLLRVYRGNSIEGSNPSLSAKLKGPCVGPFLFWVWEALVGTAQNQSRGSTERPQAAENAEA